MISEGVNNLDPFRMRRQVGSAKSNNEALVLTHTKWKDIWTCIGEDGKYLLAYLYAYYHSVNLSRAHTFRNFGYTTKLCINLSKDKTCYECCFYRLCLLTWLLYFTYILKLLILLCDKYVQWKNIESKRNSFRQLTIHWMQFHRYTNLATLHLIIVTSR